MDPVKETNLVNAIFREATANVSTVGDADAVFTFAKNLAERSVLAIRTAAIDVHPDTFAAYVVRSLNRFDTEASQDAAIARASNIAAIAASNCDAALVALGLTQGAPARSGESSLTAKPKRVKGKATSSI